MSKMEERLVVLSAQQDQDGSRYRDWLARIPDLLTAAETEIEAAKSRGIGVYVERHGPEIRIVFPGRPVRLPDEGKTIIETGAQLIFYFENRTSSVQSFQVPFADEGSQSNEKSRDHGELSSEEFVDTIVDFVEWATIGNSCGRFKTVIR